MNAPMCVSDILWLLCRQPSMSAGGVGISPNEAKRMTLEEIYNLLRPADKKGRPINEAVEMRQVQADYVNSREDASDIKEAVKGIINGKRRSN